MSESSDFQLERYSAKKLEDKWTNHIIESNSNTSSDKAYSISIPPPNVTGNLHLGHALFYMLAVVALIARPFYGKCLFVFPDVGLLKRLFVALLQFMSQEQLLSAFVGSRACIFHVVIVTLLDQSTFFEVFLTLLPPF